MALIAHYLRHQGVLALIEERVRFVRRRFGHYDLIDFVVVLLGYAISGERTLETFYERMQPFATTFMALFGRDRLPARSTLSRFLAALDRTPVEALRTVFLEDLLARPLLKKSPLHRPSQAEVSLPERSAAVPLDSLNGRVGERDVSPFLGDPAPQRTFPLSPDTWSGYLRGDR